MYIRWEIRFLFRRVWKIKKMILRRHIVMDIGHRWRIFTWARTPMATSPSIYPHLASVCTASRWWHRLYGIDGIHFSEHSHQYPQPHRLSVLHLIPHVPMMVYWPQQVVLPMRMGTTSSILIRGPKMGMPPAISGLGSRFCDLVGRGEVTATTMDTSTEMLVFRASRLPTPFLCSIQPRASLQTRGSTREQP